MRRALLLLLLLLLPRPVVAETLIAAASPAVVRIEQHFSGAEITVFGVIERDRLAVSRADRQEIAVTVFGPEEHVVVRRKTRVAGLWINTEAQDFVAIPGFYAALTSAPLADLGTPEALGQYRIGFEHLLNPDPRGGADAGGADEHAFRAALVRNHVAAGVYVERPGAVEFLSPTLFRAVIPLPARAPTGSYRVEVTLLQGGVPLAETATALAVMKIGFEEWMYQAAFRLPLLYGLGTVLVGLAAGWLAGILFRRD
jgi:uncharacterized protein (TIGR02186 family)